MNKPHPRTAPTSVGRSFPNWGLTALKNRHGSRVHVVLKIWNPARTIARHHSSICENRGLGKPATTSGSSPRCIGRTDRADDRVGLLYHSDNARTLGSDSGLTGWKRESTSRDEIMIRKHECYSTRPARELVQVTAARSDLRGPCISRTSVLKFVPSSWRCPGMSCWHIRRRRNSPGRRPAHHP